MAEIPTQRARLIVDIDVSTELVESRTLDNGETFLALSEEAIVQLKRMLGGFTIVNTKILSQEPNSARADLPPTESRLVGIHERDLASDIPRENLGGL